jgi:hypothetical protein
MEVEIVERRAGAVKVTVIESINPVGWFNPKYLNKKNR